jgi:two-component system chemotaxis response regulator CheB
MEREVTNHDVIVIGASAGGVDILQQLAAGLPRDLPAAVFVAMHVPAYHKTLLPEILTRSGPLPASEASDGERIRHGHIYVARAGRHLLLERGRVRVAEGPKENGHRPSIDVLFRSASRAYGPRVIAVVLSGRLDDGATGALAVKRRGGLFVVQAPQDAAYSDMPRAAIEAVGSADYMVPRSELPMLLAMLSRTPAPPEDQYPVPLDLAVEDEIAHGRESDAQVASLLGAPSPMSCPDCGGVLWDLSGSELRRFRCQVGHAFSAVHLFHEQAAKLEANLWRVVRGLREHSLLARQIRRSSSSAEWQPVAARFQQVAADSDELASRLLRHITALSAEHETVQEPEPPHPGRKVEGPSPLSRLLASVAPTTLEEPAEAGAPPKRREPERADVGRPGTLPKTDPGGE